MKYSYHLRPGVAQGHKVWLSTWLIVGSIPLEDMKYLFKCIFTLLTLLYISFFSLWCPGKARRWVTPLNTQSLQNSAESGERSLLTLGSLCLSWRMKLIFIISKLLVKIEHKEASGGAGAQGCDRLWVRLPLEEIFIVSFLRSLIEARSAPMSSTSQHTMLPEFGGKGGAECFNTRLPLLDQLLAG